ncbi:hypothetical protein [Streptomyces sp. QHH-9511]|nr:hypothetical protein [Streptomyces sp. QHH-9511]
MGYGPGGSHLHRGNEDNREWGFFRPRTPISLPGDIGTRHAF